MTDNTESEDIDGEVLEGVTDEQPTVTVEIPLDDVHSSLYTTLGDGGVDVDTLLAANLRQPMESTLHNLYQRGKYE